MPMEPDFIGEEDTSSAGHGPRQGNSLFEATDFPPRSVEDGAIAQRNLGHGGDGHRDTELAEPDPRCLQAEAEQRQAVEQCRPRQSVNTRQQHAPALPEPAVDQVHAGCPVSCLRRVAIIASSAQASGPSGAVHAPVSYTHLDVYKRQGMHNSHRCLLPRSAARPAAS